MVGRKVVQRVNEVFEGARAIPSEPNYCQHTQQLICTMIQNNTERIWPSCGLLRPLFLQRLLAR